MKSRPQGFLSEKNISHDSDIFDYVAELHSYIWRFIRVARPGSSGDISKLIDDVIDSLEAAQQSAQADKAYCYGPNNHLLKDGELCSECGLPKPPHQ